MGDATYDDHVFQNYVERGEVWERKEGEGATMTTITTGFDKVKWVRRESEYLRGKLDWFFLLNLILLTLTHIVLVLNLMHEISLARRKNELQGYPDTRLSVTTAVTTTACILGTDMIPPAKAEEATQVTLTSAVATGSVEKKLTPTRFGSESEFTLGDPTDDTADQIPQEQPESAARAKRREQYVSDDFVGLEISRFSTSFHTGQTLRPVRSGHCNPDGSPASRRRFGDPFGQTA